MNCFYCGHELSIVQQILAGYPDLADEQLTKQWDVPCRHCGASYHIEQQVAGLPTIGEEMIGRIRKA